MNRQPARGQTAPRRKTGATHTLASHVSGAYRALLGGSWTAVATSGAWLAQQCSRDSDLFCRATRGWARALVRAWKLDVVVTKADGSPLSKEDERRACEDAPCIFMCNHRSYADIVVLMATLPLYPHFVAKQQLGRVPFLGQALRAGHHILIDRSGGRAALRSLKEAAAKIREGRSVLVFPEGTRGADEGMQPFRSGAFRLAKEAGVTVVPVAIQGTEQVLPRDAWLVQRASVRVSLGAPIDKTRVKALPVRVLMDEVRSSMATLLGESLDDPLGAGDAGDAGDIGDKVVVSARVEQAGNDLVASLGGPHGEEHALPVSIDGVRARSFAVRADQEPEQGKAS